MKNYIVLYRDEKIMCPSDAPFGFQCFAKDTDHAEEQCENAYSGVDVVWVWEGPEGSGMEPALEDYYLSDTDDLDPYAGSELAGGQEGA